jgi:hypothetical protein
MEITNIAQAEKHRIQALVKLVGDLKEPKKEDLFHLLQPWEQPALKAPAVSATFDVARDSKLVSVDEEGGVSALVGSSDIEDNSAFQRQMAHALLGVTDDEQSHYRFNLFSAWYAVQDEKVFLFKDGRYDIAFNDQMYPNESQRQFNDTKLPPWRRWAAFLGLGWVMKQRLTLVLVPDATRRLQPLLPEIFREQQEMVFYQFMERLASLCPELDGGELYRQCWQASRGSETKGNSLSLMLSTALRSLDSLKQIRLINQADALKIWQLYPAQGHPQKLVTHIEYIGGK